MPSHQLKSSTDNRSESVATGLSPKEAMLLLGCGLAATALIYRDVFEWLWRMWSSNDDYSHGFLVPVVSLYVLWTQRDSLTRVWNDKGSARWLIAGVGALLAGLVIRLLGIYTSIRTLEGLSLIPFLFGVVAIAVGWGIARRSVPALLYLAFMVPLPHFLAGKFSGVLQTVGTQSSEFLLQTVGVPAVAEGNIIHLSQGTIGVAEACSGLRMLYAFFALTIGVCLVIERSWIEKLLIIVSAVPIAIAVNCLRITATGLAYEFGDPALAEQLFHDVAGWLMMPVGLLMLLAVLEILRRVILHDEQEVLPATKLGNQH